MTNDEKRQELIFLKQSRKKLRAKVMRDPNSSSRYILEHYDKRSDKLKKELNKG